MLKMLRTVQATFAIVCLFSAIVQSALFDGVQPTILSVSPRYGSIAGGTALKIYGVNFQPTGFFSELQVFIGNEECKVVKYYSSNDQIYCITPACNSDACRRSKSLWPVSELVDVSVYVYTVAGILGDYSSFTYASDYTPSIQSMDTSTWATSIATINGKFYTDNIKKIDITIAQNHVSLGFDSELNPEELEWNRDRGLQMALNYRPPNDMKAGYYDMTVTLKPSEVPLSTVSTGYATFFPRDAPNNQYSVTATGTVYLIALYPVVTSISPSTGSIAGGTAITISGHGFSSDMSDLTVLVGGVNCDVTTASMNEITCVTNPIEKSGTTQSVLAAFSTTEPYSSLELSNGSPGAFVKVYDNSNTLTSSFSWHKSLSFNQLSDSNSPFRADVATVLIAPFSAEYSFFVVVDDAAEMYYSFSGVGVDEQLLSTTTYSEASNSYYTNDNQRSRPIFLRAQQRLFLRVKWMNYQTNNRLSIAVKISFLDLRQPTVRPSYRPSKAPSARPTEEISDAPSSEPIEEQSTEPSSEPTDLSEEASTAPSEEPSLTPEVTPSFSPSRSPTGNASTEHIPQTLFDHYQLREIQKFGLKFDNFYETQVITLSGVTSGSFALIMQDSVVTSFLRITSTFSEISSAIRTALTAQLVNSDIECNSFSGSAVYNASSLTFTIILQFVVDNAIPKTLVQVLDVSLIGPSKLIRTRRSRFHSTIPSGYFSLNVLGNTITNLLPSISSTELMNKINAISSSIIVAVTTLDYDRYHPTWQITFYRPFGDVAMIELDTSNLIGDNTDSFVTTVLEGSLDSILLDPIPLWMMEIPLHWATSGAVGSNVEVFQKVSTASNTDVLKAICDGSGDASAGFSRYAKGLESTCGYNYLAQRTPIVTGYSMTSSLVDDVRVYSIAFTGSGFLIGNGNVSVTIGDAEFAATAYTNNSFTCTIPSVPWGSYIPSVSLMGVGKAVSYSNASLDFIQAVNSISPLVSSFAGGQSIVISGYGFRSSAQVLLFDSSPCTIKSITAFTIVCTTPPVPSSYFDASTTFTTQLLVDDTSGGTFEYSLASTPIVTSISSYNLSSAADTFVNFTGSGFPLLTSSVSVQIGNFICSVVSTSDTEISCFLPRTTSTLPSTTANVVITVMGKGYAGLSSELNSLPTITRGFEILSISPSYGSNYGGTHVLFSGVGFVEGMQITFSDSVSSTSYARLILALGIEYTSVTSHVQKCAIVALSFNSIECVIDRLVVPIDQNNNTLMATIAVNDIFPFTQSDALVTIVQSILHTPVVDSVSNLGTNTATGVTSLRITGSLLYYASAVTSVSIGGIACSTSTSSTSTSLLISCVNLTAGPQTALVHITSKGYAKFTGSSLVDIDLVFDSCAVIAPYLPTGSVLGGSMYSITGFGFSSICSQNSISFLLADGRSLNGSSFLQSCNSTTIQGLTPPALRWNEDYVGFSQSVTSTIVRVNGKTSTIASFSFDYSATNTPRLNSLSFTGDTLLISATFPYSNIPFSSPPAIQLNNEIQLECTGTATSADFTTIGEYDYSCSVPSLQAGNYSVYMNVLSLGNVAASSTNARLPSINVTLSIDAFPSTVYSSARGGLVLNITGRGLSPSLTVSIDGIPTPSTLVESKSLLVMSPALVTTSYVDSLAAKGIDIDLIETLDTSNTQIATPFSSISATSSSNLLPFDTNYKTSFLHDDANCFIGVSMVGSHRIQPYRMRFYPQYQTSRRISTVYFEGSTNGGATYVQLGNTTSRVHEGWNYIEASVNSTWYTHLRYRVKDSSSSKSKCTISEIKFLGTIATTKKLLSISVYDSDTRRSYSLGNISYADAAATPKVLHISPQSGTSLGGTVVTLTGVYGSTVVPPTVVLNGIACAVQSWDTSSITCITGYRGPDNIQTGSVLVNIPGYGNSISGDDVLFTYMDRWSDVRSWRNRRLPVDGDFVWIPAGQSIILDQDTPNLLFLLVQGALYLDSTVAHIAIDSKYIFVYGGLLQIGTAENPYQSNVTITLHGDRYTDIDMPEIGVKCLVVASIGLPLNEKDGGAHLPGRNVGQLEIHGKKRLRTWTKLASTALAGSSTIVTSERVDFAPGDKLVLSGTELGGSDFNIDEVIVKTNVDGFTIEFEEPLKYTHKSEIVTVGGRIVDIRGEVGLLNRNVVIRGDENSQGQLFGVHMVARMSGIFRVENAEIYHCGQAFILGRYCTHSHRAGNMEGSYVKANSIHHSFQRAVTTHDTSYWEVRDNVAYDVMGHTYFVEDGTEQYNTFSGNLGIRTKVSSALLASDLKPAVFWTSNPTNFWYDNVGANSDSFGFWFELSGRPNNFLDDGDFDICPVHEPIGEFSNNTFHANAVMGLRIYPEYTPYADPCDGSSGPAPQYLYDLVSFRNGLGFFNKRGGDLHHVNYSLIENYGDGISIVKFDISTYTKDPNIVGAVIVGSLNPSFNVNTDLGGKNAIRLPQHEYFYVKDITVVNYGKSAAFSGCNSCDVGADFAQGGFTTRFENIKFEKSGRRIGWTPHFKEIFWDLDGTLTGQVGGMVTKNYLFNHFPGCVVADPSIYDDSLICNSSNKIRRLALDYFTPSSLNNNALTVQSAAGSANIPFFPLDIYGWVMPVVNSHSYGVEWKTSGQSASAFSLRYTHAPYLLESYLAGENESILISYTSYRFDYIAYSYVNTLYDREYWVSMNTSVTTEDDMGASYYNSSSRELDIVLSSKNANFQHGDDVCYISTSARLCPPEGCPLPPRFSFTSNYTFWSNNESWVENGGFPVAGQTFNISADRWVVLDISTPPLGCIIVYGKLSILSGSGNDIILKAQCIQVFGVLEINGFVTPSGFNDSNAEYNGTASIVLYGTKEEVVPLVMGEGLFIGSKHIGVAGVFSAKGKTRTSYQAKLSTTAALGSTSISVVSPLPLGWVVGDEIVVSATGYFNEAGKLWSDDSAPGNEKRTVTSISSVAQGSGLLSTIGFSAPLQQTHLCTTVLAESFCASVGLLTRNVKIVSEDITDSNNGFGGHISVVDIVSNDDSGILVGQISLDSIELVNLGKLNTSYYSIGVNYRFPTTNMYPNTILNCAFIDGFNFALYTKKSNNITISGNVIYEAYGGGVFIDSSVVNAVVTSNMVLSLHQFPSLYLNGYFWTVPIASFTFNSFTGVYKNNLAAGSFDTGFSVATSVFSGYNGAATPSTIEPLNSRLIALDLCRQTNGAENSIDTSSVLSVRIFADNEAVGCRVGLMVVNDDRDESTSDTCAFVSGFKAWRNAHIGIGGVDAIANTLLSNVVVAENHIGISFSYFRTAANGFSGVANSKVIGTLSSSKCVASAGTTWTVQKCQAFSEDDPFGLSSSCLSVFGSSDYTRVGILIPQSTNGAKTCRLAGRFQEGTCAPSIYPDRLCALPWEKRYGLPSSALYAEHHILNTEFTGFSSDSACPSSFGAAVALNPSQIDIQPIIVSSALVWTGESSGVMDKTARIGTSISPEYECSKADCMGHHQLVVHDFRGFLLGTADTYLPDATSRNNVAGKILFDNPAFSDPLSCHSASNLGPFFYTCLNYGPKPFRTFTGLWLDDKEDSEKANTGPVVVKRSDVYDFTDTRDFAGFAPQFDPCPRIMPTNRFSTMFAAGFYHKVYLTASIPKSWFIRWDSPSSTDVALLDIFIFQPFVLRVYTGSSIAGPFTLVPKIYTTPTLSDPAGQNCLNPQSRNLTVIVRGGTNNLYRFESTPVVAVTIRMEMSLADFFSVTFVANVATLLGISANRVAIAGVRSGSVIVDFQLLPDTMDSPSNSVNATEEFMQLEGLAADLSTAASSGALSTALNATILSLSVELPVNSANASAINGKSASIIISEAPTVTPTLTWSPDATQSPVVSGVPSREPTAVFRTSNVRSELSATDVRTIIIVVVVVSGVLLISAVVWYLHQKGMTHKPEVDLRIDRSSYLDVGTIVKDRQIVFL